MNTFRTFMALNLPVSTIRKVDTMVQTELRPRALDLGLKVGWVKAPNMHVTLKFLGNIPEETCWTIRDRLPILLKERPPLRLHPKGFGAFPDADKPRVIWLGLEQQDEGLTRLASVVDDWFEEIGFEREKRAFAAHLTLGRVKSGSAAELLQAPELAEVDIGPCTATDVVFYRSVLQRAGAEYTPLARCKLLGGTASEKKR